MTDVFRTTQQALLVLVAWLIASAVIAGMRKTDGHDLGMIIVGAITHKNAAQNVVLIKETESGRITALKNGGQVLGKYKVQAIYPKYMTVTSGSESILVYQSKFAGEFQGDSSPSLAIASESAALKDSYSEPGFERNGSKILVSQNLRDKLVGEELSAVLMQATAIPKIVDGEIVGFTILQIDKGSIYDKAGLRDGDVVTNINGVDLTNIPNTIKLLKSLKTAPAVQMNVTKKDGTKVPYEVKVAH